jgi:hypothetical protein
MINKSILASITLALCACSAGPQVTTVQALSDSADAPYENILVISLFKSFDSRRYLEKEIVKQLSERGIKGVASTSLMDTKTPVTRQTFMDMVEALESDAVLVTQLVNLESVGTLKDMNPKATHIFRPTYYYNVWSYELTEYVEPQRLELEHSLVLATQLYSVLNKEAVWAIEANTTIVQDFDQQSGYSVIVDEAKAITSHLARDGLIAP